MHEKPDFINKITISSYDVKLSLYETRSQQIFKFFPLSTLSFRELSANKKRAKTGFKVAQCSHVFTCLIIYKLANDFALVFSEIVVYLLVEIGSHPTNFSSAQECHRALVFPLPIIFYDDLIGRTFNFIYSIVDDSSEYY